MCSINKRSFGTIKRLGVKEETIIISTKCKFATVLEQGKIQHSIDDHKSSFILRCILIIYYKRIWMEKKLTAASTTSSWSSSPWCNVTSPCSTSRRGTPRHGGAKRAKTQTKAKNSPIALLWITEVLKMASWRGAGLRDQGSWKGFLTCTYDSISAEAEKPHILGGVQ